ncbi:MAG: GspE/PulE family protein [Pseudomonadota bacterium]|nr:GspE/PulE family protein [Pseudomonadota bacterium]
MVQLHSVTTTISEKKRQQIVCNNLAGNQDLVCEDLLDENLEKKCEIHRLLGEILLQNGSIDEKTLKKILERQQESGIRIGELLLKNNLVSEVVVRKAICEQLKIPFVDLSGIEIDTTLNRIINYNYALRQNIVPIAITDTSLTLAMVDPTDQLVVDELKSFTKLKINRVTSLSSDIKDAFERLYGRPEFDQNIIDDDDDDVILKVDESEQEQCRQERAFDEEAAKRIDKVVQRILTLALQKNSSDIHFETSERGMVIRFRIDGILQQLDLGEMQRVVNSYACEVVSRIKILGSLDIAEKRLPQDGSFRSVVRREDCNNKVDFRISVIPSCHGENIVIRILDKQKAPKTLSDLRFSLPLYEKMMELLKNNSGIILVTGPTGSGKSTTLYTSLLETYEPGKKILTAEDPIEYIYDEFMQCEVKEKIGLSFAKYIRSFLRHDPEIILIGEIRDQETAEMAVRASQTGHLVLSSLHTTDALSSVNRLKGLGVSSDMVASSLLGVLSQRLVRKICTNCKEEFHPENFHKTMAWLPESLIHYKGTGCEQCDYTGYRGRMPLAELWVPSSEDLSLILNEKDHDQLLKSSMQNTHFMVDEVLDKLREGSTTIEELLRVVPHAMFKQYSNRGKVGKNCAPKLIA